MTCNRSAANSAGPTNQSPTGPRSVNKSDIIVGMSTYNEAVAIGSVVLQAQQHADEVVTVAKHSTDKTVAIAAEAGPAVLEHSENKRRDSVIQSPLSHIQNRNPKPACKRLSRESRLKRS